jgi:hypothetical protein
VKEELNDVEHVWHGLGRKGFGAGCWKGGCVAGRNRTGEDSVQMKLLHFREYYVKDFERHVQLIGRCS